MSREPSEASFGGVALDALEAARNAQSRAEQVGRDGENHEKICAERYGNIREDFANLRSEIKGLRSIFVWCGTTGFMLVMALLGFLAKAQWDQVTELKTASYQRAELRQQISQLPPRVIIQPGQPTTGATVEREQPQP